MNKDGDAMDNLKLAQIAQHITNYDATRNARITTDWGQKVSNTDNWLSASTEDHCGPSLLEDGHAREKVSQYHNSPPPQFLTINEDPQIRP